ncbi:MAG: bacteriophage abortive infection AbiH family protein [Nitrospiraceae bacterium]
MNHKVLYIVGNGFDLHHHIKSSYFDFGHYVKSADPELYDTVEKYFSFGGKWSNLEEALGRFDADWLLEDSSNFSGSYSDEEWSDASHHDYQYEVEEVVTALSTTLKSRFTTWVTTLQIPDSRLFAGTLLNLDRNSRYLTFNYTCTLQRLYGVPPQNVLHIHNEAMSEESDLVLGHARDLRGTMSRNNIAILKARTHALQK